MVGLQIIDIMRFAINCCSSFERRLWRLLLKLLITPLVNYVTSCYYFVLLGNIHSIWISWNSHLSYSVLTALNTMIIMPKAGSQLPQTRGDNRSRSGAGKIKWPNTNKSAFSFGHYVPWKCRIPTTLRRWQNRWLKSLSQGKQSWLFPKVPKSFPTTW